jgi:UDP-N-acetylglucosamine transferase subunit ALG13
MIFVTVGTQLPFDRLIKAIDHWAGENKPVDVFAQIGPTKYEPQNIQWLQFLDAEAFQKRIEQADIIVAHAGMGSIITALQLGKPIVVMPRCADLGEHRNDHQVATAKIFQAQGLINVACDEIEMSQTLGQIDHLKVLGNIQSGASSQLLSAIKVFIHKEK